MFAGQSILQVFWNKNRDFLYSHGLTMYSWKKKIFSSSLPLSSADTIILLTASFHQKSANFAISRNTDIGCILIHRIESINVAAVLQEAEDQVVLQGLHQIPSVNWLFHHSLHFHIYYIVSFVAEMPWPLYCHYNWWGMGRWDRWGARGWFILRCGWVSF